MKFRAIKRRIYARLGNPSEFDFRRGHRSEKNTPRGDLYFDGKLIGRTFLAPIAGKPEDRRIDRFKPKRKPLTLTMTMSEFSARNLRAAMGVSHG